MANNVRIELIREAKLNKNFEEMEDPKASVYISCDSITSWIGYAENIEEVHELIKPDVLIDTLTETLSEDESDIFFNLLSICKKNYTFFDETYNLKE